LSKQFSFFVTLAAADIFETLLRDFGQISPVAQQFCNLGWFFNGNGFPRIPAIASWGRSSPSSGLLNRRERIAGGGWMLFASVFQPLAG